MKNSKLLPNMLAFATSALLLVSCRLFSNENVTPDNATFIKSDLQRLYENSFNGKSVIIKGDTIIENKPIKLHDTPEVTDIKNLTDNNGYFKMIAIGGSLTAGAREGGLYRNGQLTSFPNLIAIQMKTVFKLPLLSDKEFNGFGYKVLSTVNNSVPKYKSVSNNLALLKSDPIIELNPYTGENDNFSLPYMSSLDLLYNRPNQKFNYEPYSLPFLTRLIPANYEQGKGNTLSLVKNQKLNFFICEIGLQNYLNYALRGGNDSFGNVICENCSGTSPILQLLNYTESIKAKGCLATIPDYKDLPYFNFVLPKDVRKLFQSELYMDVPNPTENNKSVPIQDGCLLLPNEAIDSLMNSTIENSKKVGLSYTNPLSRNYVLSLDEVSKLDVNLLNDNQQIKVWANRFGLALVDLHSLFKKITTGNYITDDGVKVTLGIKSNFYSSDGINITAFGQAIVANEYIKTINSFYKTNIPLIKAGYYLDK